MYKKTMSLKNILRKHLITEVNHHLDDNAMEFIKRISVYLRNECIDYLKSCEMYLKYGDRRDYNKLSSSNWEEKAKFIVSKLPKQTSRRYSFNLSSYIFDVYFSNEMPAKDWEGAWDEDDDAILLSPIGVMKGENECISLLAHEITHIPQKQIYREDIGDSKDYFQEINDITYWCHWREVAARISQAYAYVKTQIFTGGTREGGDVAETDYGETERLVKQGGTPSHHGWNGMGSIRQDRYNYVVSDEYFHCDKQTAVNKIRYALKWYMGYGGCGELATNLHNRIKQLDEDMAAAPDWRLRRQNPAIVKNFTQAAEFLSTFLITENDLLMDKKAAHRFSKYYDYEDCLDNQYKDIIQHLFYIMLAISKRMKKMEYTSAKMAYELYTQMLRDKEYAAAHGEKPIRQTPNYDTWNKLSDYHRKKEKEDFSKLP